MPTSTSKAKIPTWCTILFVSPKDGGIIFTSLWVYFLHWTARTEVRLRIVCTQIYIFSHNQFDHRNLFLLHFRNNLGLVVRPFAFCSWKKKKNGREFQLIISVQCKLSSVAGCCRIRRFKLMFCINFVLVLIVFLLDLLGHSFITSSYEML